MSKAVQSAPRETVTAWLAKQIAAKAFSLALGLPIVTGTVMAVLAWLQGIPFAWGFLAVVWAAAGASVALNQARAFMLAYNIVGKLYSNQVYIKPGKLLPDGPEGYQMGILLTNRADTPLEYEMVRASAHLSGRVAVQRSAIDIGTIHPNEPAGYMIGLVPMELEKLAILEGVIEIEMSYGRPGKRSHKRSEKLFVAVSTDASGHVASHNVFVQ